VPSGVLLVGAGLLGAAGLLRWEVPSEHRVGAQVALLLSAVAVAAFTTAVYAPLIDDVQAHAQRFGVPLSLGTLPGWVADVWAQVGPHRWSVVFAVVTAAGAVRLAVVRRAHGVLLIALLLVPFLLSLALSTGGAPRTYVFLLPFVCIGLGVAAAGVEERLLRWLPAAAWTRAVAGCAVLLLLAAGFSRGPLSSAPETGYRRAGRFVAESTAPGDVVVVPYIVDSAVGYYSDGATVQRLREAVAGGLRRLLFLTRPGTPRFELADLMLATNFTTDAGHHADTYRNWRLPTDAFDSVSRFDRVEILEPAQPLRPAALPDLLRPDSWSLYYQSHPQATTWFPVPHPGHSARSALQVRVSNEAPAVLHSTQTFTCEADGLALLAYCKQGGGYASLYERRGGDVRALQMATPLSAPASVPTDTGPLFTELYLRPVRAGAQYGVYVTAAEDLTLCDWAVYTVPYTPTPLR
jgi:hypothetical protein